ncbi:MAG: hypothetical protein L6R42_004189 [Xanthoria sp. 1 TBL-2021]|nr:MAG: hypothetical protein L6R42_004189 [Xanthoria sp. 1 TBL-2021]
MRKAFDNACSTNTSSGAWTKLANVKVSKGRTAWPTSARQQESVGVRFDYKGEEEVKEVDNTTTTYNIFDVQPNKGKVPATIIGWSNEHGGSHSVMAIARVKKGGTQDDVKAAFAEVADFVVADKDVNEEQKKAKEAKKAEEKKAAEKINKGGKAAKPKS